MSTNSGPHFVIDAMLFEHATCVCRQKKLQFKVNMYRMREEREMSPRVFSSMLSSMLYERRFGPYFVEPTIVGIDKDNRPYLCTCDMVGAPVCTDDFSASGSCYESLFGVCQTLYKPGMVCVLLVVGVVVGGVMYQLTQMFIVLAWMRFYTHNYIYRTQMALPTRWVLACLQEWIGTRPLAGVQSRTSCK